MSRSSSLKTHGPKRGFTLIEVVIVLAIAGLIFVIVFLAVKAAQRGRRDTERQTAAERLLVAAESYASNNNGSLPANCTDMAAYFDGGNMTCTNRGTPPDATNTQRLEINSGYECMGSTPPYSTAPKSRVVAVRYWQEGGNGIFCADSAD